MANVRAALRPALLLLPGLSLGACEARHDIGTAALDSAGVAVVNNVEPAWGAAGWTLSDQPILTIGVVEGDPGLELVEPRSAFRLNDGRIVVGDEGRLQLRFYDANGKHLLDAGQRGGGPGAFQRISRVFRLPGDSLAVYDQSLLRVTIFDPNGTFVRTISVNRNDRLFPMVEGRLADGPYLGMITLRQSIDGMPDGLTTDSVSLLRFGADGRLLDTLGTFPNRVRDIQTRPLGDHLFRGAADIVFSPRTTVTLHGDRVYVGNSASYEIRVYDSDGTLKRIVRRQLEPPPATAGERASFVAWLTKIYEARNPDRRLGAEVEYYLKTLSKSPLPEHMPAFDPDVRDDRARRVGQPLIVDRQNNLWVLEYRRSGDDSPRWSVFDPAGRYLGIVAVPDRFHVTEVGSDYVLGWSSGEMDVAFVKLYRLMK